MNWSKVPNASFVVASAVLLLAVLGLHSAVRALGLILIKEELPLREPLFHLPARIGPYAKIDERNLSSDALDELGTEDYISWVYHDTRKQRGEPGAEIWLHVAYYSGTLDTVPHVPEICYVAGGARPKDVEVERVTLDGKDYDQDADGQLWSRTIRGRPVRMPAAELDLRSFEFVPRATARDLDAAADWASYFFVVNGRATGDLASLRLEVMNLRARYAYWCKVQLRATGARSRDEAMRAKQQFLSAVMPEIMAKLPDWHEVMAGRYPEPR